MPKLARLRLVGIGHPRARFDDLTLDFRDDKGRADDTVIWLRNGGGKSSLLNLFYSIVRPRQTDFLGGKGREEHRRLTDYVQADDNGVIVSEWELDGAEGFLESMPPRYLTGVFHEYKSGSESDGTGASLQRLFFAAEVDPGVPSLTLEGLPLMASDSDGGRMRRSMANFRREWRELHEAYPAREVFHTDKQGDWVRQLESRGIDTQLFGYQLDMNSREGGVTELFTFKDQDDFVDFLLETAFDPEDAERVRQQVQTFRRELSRRHEQLLPDRDLCYGLLEHLEPFAKLAQQRNQTRHDLTGLFRMHDALQQKLDVLSAGASGDIARLRQESTQRRTDAEHARQTSRLQAARSIALRRLAVAMRLDAAMSEQRKRQEEMERATRETALWKAAVPLADALNREQEARVLRDQLQERKAEHAPLFDRLSMAAGLVAVGVSESAKSLRQQASQAEAVIDEQRRQARRKRQEAGERGEAAARAETEVQTIARQMEEGEAAWRRLVEQGVATRSETPESAGATIARLDAELKEVRGTEESLIAERRQQEAARTSLREQREQRLVRQVELRKDVADTNSRIEEVMKLRDGLAHDHTLLALLQTDAVEIDNACASAIQQARADAQRALEAIFELRLASADDQRALTYLKEYGRLPPNQNALAVLEHLRAHGFQCWSGWEYLEQNVPAEKRRVTLGIHPHLAAGVLLQDHDYEAALSCDRDSLHLSGPVVIARATSLLQQSEDANFVVWGPTGDGLFDAAAAGRSEAEIEQRLHDTRAQESQKTAWRESLQDLLHRLDDYLRRYPAGWLKGVLSRRQQIANDLKSLDVEITEHTLRLSSIEAAISSLTERENSLRQQESTLSQHTERAHAFVERYGKHLSVWRELQKQRTLDAADARQGQRTLEADAVQLEAEADTSEAAVRSFGERARTFEHELEQIRHVRPPLPAISSVPLESLRADYHRLLDEYEQKVGAESLEHLARQRDHDAQEARRRFEKSRDRSIAESEIADAIRALPGGVSVDDRRQEADSTLWAAKQATGNIGAQISRLEDRQRGIDEEEQKKDLANLRVAVEDAQQSPESAEAEAAKADQTADSLSRQSDAYEKQVNEFGHRVAQVENELTRMRACRDRLNTIHQAHVALAAHVLEANATTAISLSDKVDSLTGCVAQLEGDLSKAAQQWQQMNDAAESQLRKIHAWCREERFASLPDGVARRVEEFDAATVEARADYLREHLETRIEQIEADIAEADKQRDIVIDAVMSAVDQALDLLKRVARLSRLPDSVLAGGRHFLDISTQAPDNPTERRGRIGELVHETIQSGKLDNGLELVQRAVRRVAKPIRVRVMHPDLDAASQRVAIPQMANFSGGERLTAAILLYCALAKLRGQQLGQIGKRTAVLLLDNPIGTVSRVRYLDLQREVAKALGIQLIYATGVHDLDAIGTLPNVLRLRNSRRDKRTGRRFVEIDTDGAGNAPTEGIIDAVRVHTQPIPSRNGEDVPASDAQ